MLKEVPEPTLASTSDSLSQESTEESTLQDSLSSLTSHPFPASSSGETLPASTPQDSSSASTSKDPPFDATPEETPQDPVSNLTPENPSTDTTQQDLMPSSVPIEDKELATDDIHQAAEQHSPSSASSGVLPIYNILLLGPTQSGKSTFLENVKQYANPEYTINTTRIGTGNESHTQTSCVEDIITTLPIFKVYDEKGVEFDTGGLKDERGFKRFLARDDDLELRPVEVPGSPEVWLRIFDTPGLNDTNGNDIQNIASTFSALSEVGHLNLIIIMDSHHVPLNPSQKDAFGAYFDLFSDLKGLITVVHTHSPNKCRVPGMNILHDRKLKERSDFFNKITGLVIPTKRIDCDPSENEPGNLCMTRNAIREILEMAKVKAAVTLNTTNVYKTRFMLQVDASVHEAYRAKLNEHLKECQSESQKLIVDIEKTEEEIKNKNKDIEKHNTNDLLLLFERRFSEDVNFFSWWADLAGRANHEHIMELPGQEYTIENVKVSQQEIHVFRQSGGKGHKSWSVRFKRHAFKTGYYHAVLKMKKSTRYQKDIERWRSEVMKLKEELKTKRAKRQELSTMESQEEIGSSGSSSNEFVKLKNMIINCRRVVEIAAAENLPLELFMELANASVYHSNSNPDLTNEHHRILEQHAEKVPQVPPKV